MRSVTCQSCGQEFEAARATRRFCSQTCQKRARRAPASTAKKPAAKKTAAKGSRKTSGKKAAAATKTKPTKTPGSNSSETPTSGSTEAVTRRTLEEAGKVDTVGGCQALTVAARLDALATLGSGSDIATLSRELSRLMALVVGKSGEQVDPVDEVKRKRDEKLAKARAASS